MVRNGVRIAVTALTALAAMSVWASTISGQITFGAPSDLVAYSVDGGSLGSSGFTRRVIPGDNRGGRYVSNLASIQVQTVPEPSTMALLGIALSGLVSLHSRRAWIGRVSLGRRRP